MGEFIQRNNMGDGSNRFLVFNQNIILTVLIHNFRTSWPSKVSIPILSSLDSLLYNACIVLRKSVDNFEIAHETC